MAQVRWKRILEVKRMHMRRMEKGRIRPRSLESAIQRENPVLTALWTGRNGYKRISLHVPKKKKKKKKIVLAFPRLKKF